MDAIGPLAARQIVAALRHDPRGPRFVRGLELKAGPCGHRLVAEVLREVPIHLAFFELGPGPSLREECRVDAVAPVGPWRCVLDDDQFRRAYSLVLTANSEEYHHLPMLEQG